MFKKSKIYKDITRCTKYQAAAGLPNPAWPRGAGPVPVRPVAPRGRAGRGDPTAAWDFVYGCGRLIEFFDVGRCKNSFLDKIQII